MKDFVFVPQDARDRVAAHVRPQFVRMRARGRTKQFAKALRHAGFDATLTPDVAALTKATGHPDIAKAMAAAFSIKSPDQATPRIIDTLTDRNDLTGPIVQGMAHILHQSGLSADEISMIFDHLSHGTLAVSVGTVPAGEEPKVATSGGSTSVSLPPPPASEQEDGDTGSGDDTGTNTGATDGKEEGGTNVTPDADPEPPATPEPKEPSGKGFWGLLNAALTGAAKGAAVGGAFGAVAGGFTGPGATATAAEGAAVGAVGGGVIGAGAYLFGEVMALPDGSGDLVWY